ncbi:MAG: helix-turn-helix domain-containing protein [Bradymonadaceae bacterium]
MSTSLEELEKQAFDEGTRREIRWEAALEAADLELRELRERQGLTQEQMAERMETVQPQLSSIENSEDLYLSTLRRYAQALGGRLEVTVAIEEDGETVRIPVRLSDSVDEEGEPLHQNEPKWRNAFQLWRSSDRFSPDDLVGLFASFIGSSEKETSVAPPEGDDTSESAEDAKHAVLQSLERKKRLPHV